MRNRSNDSNYHWDYQDYRGNYGQSPARARKSSGLKYFLIAMGVVILLVGALGQQACPAAGSGFVHRQ